MWLGWLVIVAMFESSPHACEGFHQELQCLPQSCFDHQNLTPGTQVNALVVYVYKLSHGDHPDPEMNFQKSENRS